MDVEGDKDIARCKLDTIMRIQVDRQERTLFDRLFLKSLYMESRTMKDWSKETVLLKYYD